MYEKLKLKNWGMFLKNIKQKNPDLGQIMIFEYYYEQNPYISYLRQYV